MQNVDCILVYRHKQHQPTKLINRLVTICQSMLQKPYFNIFRFFKSNISTNIEYFLNPMNAKCRPRNGLQSLAAQSYISEYLVCTIMPNYAPEIAI